MYLKIDKHRVEVIREDAKTMTTKQLAWKHSVCVDHMYKVLRKHKIQAFMVYPGKRWTKDDVYVLKVCAGKISVSGIAKLLGRTPVAVESRCELLGIYYGRHGLKRGARKWNM